MNQYPAYNGHAAARVHAAVPKVVGEDRAPPGHSSSAHSTPGDWGWDVRKGGVGGCKVGWRPGPSVELEWACGCEGRHLLVDCGILWTLTECTSRLYRDP